MIASIPDLDKIISRLENTKKQFDNGLRKYVIELSTYELNNSTINHYENKINALQTQFYDLFAKNKKYYKKLRDD